MVCWCSLSPHRLRHTFGTLATASLASKFAKTGDILANVRSLQNFMGHTSLLTTVGYIEPDIEQLRHVVDSMPSVDYSYRLDYSHLVLNMSAHPNLKIFLWVFQRPNFQIEVESRKASGTGFASN